jgi:hypothetical protein
VFREWQAAGSPDPTTEEIATHERKQEAEELIWITGAEVIRPPTKPLTVSTEMGQDSHTFAEGAQVLPPLLVAGSGRWVPAFRPKRKFRIG